MAGGTNDPSDISTDYLHLPDRRPVDKVDGGARRAAIITKTCVIGQHPVTEDDFNKFTEAGKREFNISGSCEPCFDKAFAEPELPTLKDDTELQLRRTPEALAAEAASTDRTYGNHCYFGGGLLVRDASEVMFVLQRGENTSTDETTCKPCWDRVLGAMVKESLDAAEANGYDLREWDASEVASDIGTYDASLDGVQASFMLPFVERWIEEGQIAKAESGADREG